MKCVNPSSAHLANGKVYFSTRGIEGVRRFSVKIACGHCWQCRRESSLDTAVRAQHESHYWTHSFFLTLTYDNLHLPKNSSLSRPHITAFVRELKRNMDIMIFGCGEYGGKFGRPHYHLILFSNHDIHSEEYQKHWSFGHIDVGECTPASIAYVCKYSVKKVLGPAAHSYYADRGIIPEFGIFPKRPAMGRKWLEDNLQHIISNNFVYYNNSKRRIPRYYKKILAALKPEAALSKSILAQQYMIESSIDTYHVRFARTFNYLKMADRNSYRSDNIDAFYLSFFQTYICGN